MIMKIPSHDLEAFYVLTETGNFTKAAKSMGLSQPAFSSRIKNLESHLEQTLIVRDKKGIRLTPEGEKLLAYVKMYKQMEEEFLGGEELGQIRLGAFSSIMRSMVMPALSPLLKKRPNVGLELFTRELDELLPLLRQGQVDFILTNRDPKREGLKAELLGVEENVLVAHKKYPAHPIFLDHDPNDVTTSSYFSLLKTSSPQNKRYLDDVYGLLEGVKLGMGRAILPKHLIKNEKNLIIQNPRTILKVNIFLVYRDQSYMSELHQQVMEHLRTIGQ